MAMILLFINLIVVKLFLLSIAYWLSLHGGVILLLLALFYWSSKMLVYSILLFRNKVHSHTSHV